MRKIDIYLCIIPYIVLLGINISRDIVVNGSSHDLFASLFELEMIWTNELEVIEVMERVVRKWKEAPNEFRL